MKGTTIEKENGKHDPEAAAAILDADRNARAKELHSIIARECERLRCDLVAVAEIVGNQVATRINITAR